MHSLFFLPAVLVAMSILGAYGTLEVDRRFESSTLPAFLDTSVDNARTMLGVLAGGTITAASIVFSLTLLTVQLASSQYGPRSLHNFLGDRFTQVVIGVVMSTFSFCAVALRGVEGPTADTAPFVPRLTVATAWVLGVVALFAVLASINHTARGLRVATIANRVTDETLDVIRQRYGDVEEAPADPVSADDDRTDADLPAALPAPPDALVVGSPSRGWVQQMSIRLMVSAVPQGSTLRLVVHTGEYVQEGQPVLLVTPTPDRPDDVRRQLHRAVVVGPHRTMQQDVAFGIIQLIDIALRALSPGVNDPQTAQEVFPRLTAIITELLIRDLTPRRVEDDGRVVIRTTELEHADFVDLAISSVRRAARTDPLVLAALVVALGTARDETQRRRPGADVGPLADQVSAILADLDGLAQPHDVAHVREAARRAGFGGDTSAGPRTQAPTAA